MFSTDLETVLGLMFSTDLETVRVECFQLIWRRLGLQRQLRNKFGDTMGSLDHLSA